MLRSLEINNYRNLKHLSIERLGRVNLLLGKNNTGKTSVLEAVSIHINRGRIDFLLQLLDERGENYIRSGNSTRRNLENTKESTILRTLAALFTDRKVLFGLQGIVMIGEVVDMKGFSFEKDAVPDNIPNGVTILRFVRFLEEYDETQIGRKKRVPLLSDTDDPEAILGFEARSGQSVFSIPLRNIERSSSSANSLQLSLFEEQSNDYQFVKTKNIERDVNGTLWDKIALTESEDEVINALKIIEPDIDRITFRNERERVPVVKLKSSNDVVPLRSMGDGINRILTIILAMVNCENGYLLIDEFENGLHYSVQEQLWEVIFSVAERLNIQVFATTHSYDCIDAFSAVLNSGRHQKESGFMIRLDNYEGNIEATLYDADEIQTTTRVHVDPR